MVCIAVMESGNYALALSKELEDIGVVSQVISTPCKLSGEGCGYSVKFDLKDKETVERISLNHEIKIKSYFKSSKELFKSKYQKIQ